jgi:hypothetical protein
MTTIMTRSALLAWGQSPPRDRTTKHSAKGAPMTSLARVHNARRSYDTLVVPEDTEQAYEAWGANY